MSASTTQKGSLFRMLATTFAVVVAVTVFLVAVSWLVGSISGPRHPLASGDSDQKALAERLAPFGTLNVAGTAPAAPAVPAAAPPAESAADGKSTYDSACAACHSTGVAGAPKLGDAANWKARLAQGKDTLYQHAIGGFQGKAGVMPAKGGNAALSDAAVKAAVDHILAGSQ